MSGNKGSAFIKQNPLGPHYYVSTRDKPNGFADKLTDMMNNWLQEMDISHEDIRADTEMFEVSWNGDNIEIDYPEKDRQKIVEKDWYEHNAKKYCDDCGGLNYNFENCDNCGSSLE
jgi:hypothetical protein